MKPICVPCQRFFQPKKNGFAFIEGHPIAGSPAPGVSEPEKWRPYKLWEGDEWECKGCGAMIVVGCGSNPIAEHYEENFRERVKSFGGDQLQVNDC